MSYKNYDDYDKQNQIYKGRYIGPASPTRLWQLPPAEEILSDLRACGCSISLLIERVISANEISHGLGNSTVLLSALLEQLKQSPESLEKWKELRTLDEERNLVEIENLAWNLARQGDSKNSALMKFLLERRDPLGPKPNQRKEANNASPRRSQKYAR